jgi:hypothetical protein
MEPSQEGRRRLLGSASNPIGVVAKRPLEYHFAAISEDVASNHELVIEARVGTELVARTEAAVTLVASSYDNQRNPRRERSTGTERAGLARHDQLRVEEPPGTLRCGRVAEGEHGGVRRRVAAGSNLVMARGENTTTLVEHEGGDRDVAVDERLLGVSQRCSHRSFVIEERAGELHGEEATGGDARWNFRFQRLSRQLASSDSVNRPRPGDGD